MYMYLNMRIITFSLEFAIFVAPNVSISIFEYLGSFAVFDSENEVAWIVITLWDAESSITVFFSLAPRTDVLYSVWF